MLLSSRVAGVKPLTIQAPDAYREGLDTREKRQRRPRQCNIMHPSAGVGPSSCPALPEASSVEWGQIPLSGLKITKVTGHFNILKY